MSKVSSLVLGVVSGAAMFGAIQYASGNDLRGTLTDRDTAIRVASVPSVPSVNRTAKGDREMAASKIDQGQTLSFKVHGLIDTSVLLRLAGPAPSGKDAKDQPTSRAISIDTKPRKATVACEPPVSRLTEVAKLLEPGRCVT